MNNSGQVKTLLTFLSIFAFGIVWLFYLAPLFAVAGSGAELSGATGLELWFYNNLNLVMFFVIVIVLGGVTFYANN